MCGARVRASSARGRRQRSRGGGVAVFALALLAAGCTTDNSPKVMAASARASTVAFESVDGPPMPIFQNLVAALAEEAVVRNVAVVSRQAKPDYRIRGYLAVVVDPKGTHIAWVWDVYDTDKRRALRIEGEEAGPGRGRDMWAAANDQVLHRIARVSMERFAVFLAASPASEPPASPAEGEDNVAVAGTPEVTVPLPPRRPQRTASVELRSDNAAPSAR